VVTGASEDEARSTSREEETPASKREKDRLIRSAWGVVKRAMHPQDLAPGLARVPHERKAPRGSPNEAWVPVVEVSLAESWSHASLVDDLLRSS
jgi:hypothetical protein